MHSGSCDSSCCCCFYGHGAIGGSLQGKDNGKGNGCVFDVMPTPMAVWSMGLSSSGHTWAGSTIGVCAGQPVRYYGPEWLCPVGLHGITRATLCSIGSWRDATEHFAEASRGPDLVGPGRLTCYAIGTTASASDPRGIFYRPILIEVIRHSTRRAPRPFGAAGPSSGSVRRRARKLLRHLTHSWLTPCSVVCTVVRIATRHPTQEVPHDKIGRWKITFNLAASVFRVRSVNSNRLRYQPQRHFRIGPEPSTNWLSSGRRSPGRLGFK
jgi:hypothetical protein